MFLQSLFYYSSTASIRDRSGYGLSAFLFSTIAHIFFTGSTSTLLLVLSLGSSFPMILGFFFVRPVPLLEEELNREVNSETSSSVYEQCNNSHTLLLNRDLNINGQDDHARIEVEGNSSLGSQNCETSSKSLGRGAPVGLQMFMARSNGATVIFGCYVASCQYVVSFAAYLQSLFITNILLVVSGTGLMCMSFQKKDTLWLSLLITIS